jgi:hypothetical protein
MQAENDIEAQKTATEYALRRRIHETARAKDELEWQQGQVSFRGRWGRSGSRDRYVAKPGEVGVAAEKGIQVQVINVSFVSPNSRLEGISGKRRTDGGRRKRLRVGMEKTEGRGKKLQHMYKKGE